MREEIDQGGCELHDDGPERGCKACESVARRHVRAHPLDRTPDPYSGRTYGTWRPGG